MSQQQASPKPLVRRRYTKKQIQERRMQVWEMLCCGFPLEEIAQRCSVSERTIQRDKAWWDERLGYNTEALKDPKNAAMDVGMTAAMLKQLSTDAYCAAITTNNDAFKQRYMETAGRMLVQRHKILADAGFLPKVGHEQEEQTAVKISFEARFGKDAPQAIFDNDKSRRRVLEAVYGALDLGIASLDGQAALPPPLPGDGEVIDAEVIDVTSSAPEADSE